MTAQFRPMLANTIKDVRRDVRFPIIASPKLDGIRCVIRDGKALSRSLKLIPNVYVRRFLQSLVCLEGCDGELMVADAAFSDVTSTFMRSGGQLPAGWYFGVFDYVGDMSLPYEERQKLAARAVKAAANKHVQLVPQTRIENEEELVEYERTVLSHGYEGVMVRRGSAPYKCGRSTVGDGALLKLKRFDDGEATVVGAVELLHNGNDATVSELGLTKRSSAKAGKSSSNTLGALVVKDLVTGVVFEIGTGFSAAQREEYWRDGLAGKLMGRIAKYKHFASGAKDKPRFPVFLGWRAAEDMG